RRFRPRSAFCPTRYSLPATRYSLLRAPPLRLLATRYFAPATSFPCDTARWLKHRRVVPDSDYRIKLQVFEGPLDLLLFLIRKNELDIYDIPIESVTRQYIDALRAMQQLDLDLAGEFFVMAATLM